MKRVKYFAVIMCVAIVVIIAPACSKDLSGEELDKVYDRLELVDEFNEQNVLSLSENPIVSQQEGTFRNVPFGSLRSDVESHETLQMSVQYDNAIDYTPTPVFDYNMVPTYWFNSSDQLYRGTYCCESSQPMDEIINSISKKLSNIYGQPEHSDFYNADHEVAVWNSEDELAGLIENNLVYYYADYISNDVEVDFYLEINENSSAENIVYDVCIMFTDNSYKD